MSSTARTKARSSDQEQTPLLKWRTWPLVDKRRWSWLLPIGLFGVGGIVWQLGGGWLLALAAIGGLAGTLWQFLLPVEYDIAELGLRRNAVGRTRLVPWHALRAYQLRPTGVVFYQRSDPTKFDLLRSLFVPYPADADEMLCAIRQHLSHAVELPVS